MSSKAPAPSQPSMSPGHGAVLAFISFLRCEAKLAEDRAKKLRATAAAIEANTVASSHGTKKRKRSTARSQVVATNPTTMTAISTQNANLSNASNTPTNAASISDTIATATADEGGAYIPTESLTASSLFIYESLQSTRKAQGMEIEIEVAKETMSMLAKQWTETSIEEKNQWKCRADQLNHSSQAQSAELQTFLASNREKLHYFDAAEPPSMDENTSKRQFETMPPVEL